MYGRQYAFISIVYRIPLSQAYYLICLFVPSQLKQAGSIS